VSRVTSFEVWLWVEHGLKYFDLKKKFKVKMQLSIELFDLQRKQTFAKNKQKYISLFILRDAHRKEGVIIF
jgi:hypothetical protein